MPSIQRNDELTSAKKASDHVTLMPLLEAMFREFQDASKKKPDGAVNKTKITIVNRLLKDVFAIVDGEPTRGYLDLLDEDGIPQNSDVVLILGQAVAAMEAFEAKYHRYDSQAHQKRWAVAEKSRAK
jgi:hypothetical protein